MDFFDAMSSRDERGAFRDAWVKKSDSVS